MDWLKDKYALKQRKKGVLMDKWKINFFGLLFLLMIVFGVGFVYAIEDPVVWLPFENGVGQIASDISSNGNDGIFGSTGGTDANDPDWGTGQINGAIDLDGNDFVVIPDSSDFDFGTGDFSISIWFNKTKDERGDLFNKKGGGQDFGVILESNETISVFMNGFVIQGGGSVFSLNEWHHVVVLRNGSEIRVYLDGGFDNNGTSGLNLDANTADIWLGSNHDAGLNPANSFERQIDDFRLYKRALNVSEILELNNSRGGFDLDGDGVDDSEDKCLDTERFVVVDDNGCSQDQFCRLRPICGRGCDFADWRNDDRGKPFDCRTVIVENEGVPQPRCVPVNMCLF